MIDHSLPISDGPQEKPPVYDCRVILTPPTGSEMSFRAFAGNLPEIKSTGPTERECLRKLVDLFKEKLQQYHNSNQPIPWTEPPIAPSENQQQRWIPVHL